MKQEKKERVTLKRIALYAYMILILLTLVTAATYTWFSLSQTPRVSDMNLYVNSSTGLELSLDPTSEEWTLQLDLRDMVPVTTPLRPVTWVDEEQCFYAAAYGIDGRPLPYEYWEKLSDEFNANTDTVHGYYIKLTLYAKSETAVDVTLSPAVEVDEGVNGSGTYLIGTPVWNAGELKHENGGLGAENAVRIGLLITPVDQQGEPTGEETDFFIYEPNANAHLDEYWRMENTPSITGAEHLVSEDHLIRQSYSYWEESDPVQHGVVIKELGQFLENPTLFSLQAGEMVKIDIYIWLEGQDMDCTNEIQEAQILANLQFDANVGNQSGLVPIE